MPIVPVDSFDEGLAYVNAHDHPLAMYVFSHDPDFKSKSALFICSASFNYTEVWAQL